VKKRKLPGPTRLGLKKEESHPRIESEEATRGKTSTRKKKPVRISNMKTVSKREKHVKS